MSGKIMGQVWDLKLPHAHMLVLLAYADHADHQGNNVYPGVGLIAWKAGYSLRQAQRITDELIAWGLLIEIESEPGKVPVYRINLAAGTQKPAYKGRQNVTGVKMSPVTFENHEQVPNGASAKPKRPSRVKMSPVTFENHEQVPNGASVSVKTPETPHTNRHVNHHVGGGDGRVLAFLIDQGIGAAAEFAHLPFEAMRADYEARIADGQTKPSIVRAWRLTPPTETYHYERPNGRPVQSEPAPRQSRRSAMGTHNPDRDAQYAAQLAEWQRQADGRDPA